MILLHGYEGTWAFRLVVLDAVIHTRPISSDPQVSATINNESSFLKRTTTTFFMLVLYGKQRRREKSTPVGYGWLSSVLLL